MDDKKKLEIVEMTVFNKIFEIKKEIERRDKNEISDKFKYYQRNELVKMLEVLEDIQNILEN